MKTFEINQKIRVMNGSAKGKIGSIINIEPPTDEFPTFQYEVLVAGESKLRYLEAEDLRGA